MVTRSARTAAATLATVLVLAGCDGGDDSPPDADASDERPGEQPPEADDGADPDADLPDLPDVATIDPDDVESAADPDTLDGRIASAASDLPGDWAVTVVADPTLGPYVVGLPPAATVWRVGDDLEPLRDAVADDAWLAYWDPILSEASDAVDSSSLRAAASLPAPADADVELHLTISATPRQDLPTDDPAALADAFAEAFADQQLEVEDVRTEQAGEQEVGAVTSTTPDDEFEDGVPRRLVQWFYPEVEAPIVWSVTCEGVASDAATVDEVCADVLASFRAPPR